MVLDLRQIFLNDGKTCPINCEFDFSGVDFFGGYPLKKPVRVKGKVENRAGVVEISVECEVEYSAECDRCQTPTVKTYNISFSGILVSDRAREDDDELILLNDYKLDLQEYCYNEMIPRLPMKHLCSENCKGICQKCGKNLNEGECDCTHKVADPRLEKLRELLDN